MITTADAPGWLRRSDQAVTWARTMLTPRRAAWLRAFHAVVSGWFGPSVRTCWSPSTAPTPIGRTRRPT